MLSEFFKEVNMQVYMEGWIQNKWGEAAGCAIYD